MEKKIKLLRIREAAEMLGVNPETLRRWDREGKLKAVKVSTRGDRRYKIDDIQKFIEKNTK
ncbi:helix-turn-helix domain-containing protein [Candidatus Roizmanbacteria bacterium]|nr:helix-turn-helix domain-containing protein [Candidatus Roizmanbacteria bacterium]